jgi:hypothetical protein
MMTHREVEVQLHSLFTSALHPLQHYGRTPIHIEKEAAYFLRASLDILEKRKSLLLLPESNI